MSTEEKKDFINKRLVSHYSYIESLGYEVIGVFLQGSQNYNLDIYTDEYIEWAEYFSGKEWCAAHWLADREYMISIDI